MGVPIFFVLSGYCIAASIDGLRRRDHSFREYFLRRFRRIYPPLWAAYLLGVAITLLVLVASPVSYEQCAQLPRLAKFTIGNWVGNVTASESWLPYLRADKNAAFLLPNTWTLCYEEQFYLVTGLLLALASRRFFVASYALALLALGLRHFADLFDWQVRGFFFDGYWLMFAAGILLYERLNYFGKLGARCTMGLFACGLIYGAILRVTAPNYDNRHFGEAIAAASAFAILLIYLRRWDSTIANATLLKPLAWCGKISYSVFLTHYPIVVVIACLLAMAGVRSDGMVFLVTIPTCLAASLPVAWLFHLGVERHFLNPRVEAEAK
jgi:peptidoglycan/LPS O-acetylase OafA/YrhL